MNLLDKLLPGSIRDMIGAAEHDQIWFDVDIEEFCKIATPEIIKELSDCGVRYDNETDSLTKFA